MAASIKSLLNIVVFVVVLVVALAGVWRDWIATWSSHAWNDVKTRAAKEDNNGLDSDDFPYSTSTGALPTWPHSREWGYAPSGALGTVLMIVIILLLLGRL
jgi:uncharacterized membrane protein YkgB